MRILTIDTSASACSVAVQNKSGEIYARHQLAPMQQARLVLPLINELLHSAQMTLPQLDAIAFGQGPGSFTGLRIAVSVAKGLAFALQIPLISISSLAILAQYVALHAPTKDHVLVAIDARMDEIYWAGFQVDLNRKIKYIAQDQCSAPEVLSEPYSAIWQGIGNAWQVYGSRMGFHPEDIIDESHPRAEIMLSLASDALKAGLQVTAADASPIYLRNNVTFRQSALDTFSSQR